MPSKAPVLGHLGNSSRKFVGMFTLPMRIVIALLFLFSLALPTTLSAQSAKKLKSRKGSSAYFLNQANKLKGEDPARAIDQIQQAIQYAIASNDRYTEAKAYFLLGEINFESLQYDLAITYLEKAKELFTEMPSASEGYENQKLLARAFAANFQYEQAINEYDAFIEIAKEKGHVDDQIFALQAKSDIKKQQGKLGEALSDLAEAEDIGNNNNNLDKVAEVQLQKGGVYEAQSNDSRALEEYKKSKDLSKTLKNRQGVITSNELQSNIYRKTGRKQEAVAIQKENLRILDKNTADGNDNEPIQEGYYSSKSNEEESVRYEKKDAVPEPENKSQSYLFTKGLDIEATESRTNIGLAETYIELDSAELAINYLKDAIEISATSGDLSEEKEAYGLLSKAYVQTGNYVGALATYQNYVALVDSLYQLKESDILASLNLSKELSKRLARISSLEKDRALQEQTIALLESQRTVEKERNSQLRIIIYGLVIGLLLMLLLLYFARRNSRQKRINNQLLALKSLRTQMNPHFIFNALNSVNNFISQSDERAANRYLSDFSRLMRLVLENSEHDFIPLENELEIIRLYLSLEHLRFSEKFDYELTISKDIPIEKYQIPPMIVQPYIENAVWHGLRYLDNKGKLEVSFVEEQNSLLVRIVDNGIGREKSRTLKTKNQQNTKSTAMRNIKERLDIINATHQSKVGVKVSNLNADGSGTQVEIKVEQ